MQQFRVGLLGFGTVGTGVVKCLFQNGSLIGSRVGIEPVLAKIADLDITTDRGIRVDPEILTTDVDEVLTDPDIDVIVELVGGTTIAKEFILRAFENGKGVVTANKALLAHHGDELFPAAERHGVDFYYDASVAGGIPIIKCLREGLAANHIESIYGIFNGTCNYILTRMENDGVAFNDVLREAQELGYAEAEPSLDIDGLDTAHKTSIMASLAYGQWYGMDPVHVEGIRNLELQEIRNAAELGYKIKLLGIIKMQNGLIQMRVHPTLIPTHSQLAQVSNVFNAVWVRGDIVGDTMYYGRGAGQDATASAVVADIIDVALNRQFESRQRVPGFRPHSRYADNTVAMDSISCRYYLRLQVDDRPDVLAEIAHILGASGISIASLMQRESESDVVAIIVITHMAVESAVRRALDVVTRLPVVRGEPTMIRIEDL